MRALSSGKPSSLLAPGTDAKTRVADTFRLAAAARRLGQIAVVLAIYRWCHSW
jgi:hypothetical protein